MKVISLNKAIITNYSSYKGCAVELPDSIGLKYISGKNLQEVRLGSNGAGKSTFWDSVCWCIYGIGIKANRINSILSWDEKVVEVLLDIIVDKKVHTIHRWGPPMRVELDGQPTTQDELDKLVGISRDKFIRSVIFGQGEPLFPDLPVPERGALLDSVLNLDVWERASKKATDKSTAIQKDLDRKRIDISYTEGQLAQMQPDSFFEERIELWENEHKQKIVSLETQQHLWEDDRQLSASLLTKQSEDWRKDKTDELSSKAKEIEELEIKLQDAAVKVVEPVISKEVINNLESSIASLVFDLTQAKYDLKKLDNDRKILDQEKEFLKSNNICSNCKQTITEQFKKESLEANLKSQKSISDQQEEIIYKSDELKEKFDEQKQALSFSENLYKEQEINYRTTKNNRDLIEKQIERIEREAEQLLDDLNDDKNPFISQIQDIITKKNPYDKQVDDTKKETNFYADLLDRNKKVRQQLEDKKKDQCSKIKQVESQLVAAEFWKHGFKRIRLYFINQILAALNLEIESAISALGLVGWSATLVTENETKSGSVKLGVQIKVKSPKAEGVWNGWSGGESQRLRLGIAMGLASLIQRASGVFFDWEVWDEPTMHLSGEGIEDLLQSLIYRAESLKKSIWLVDHSALTFSGFSEIWNVVKDENGSRIELLDKQEPHV